MSFCFFGLQGGRRLLVDTRVLFWSLEWQRRATQIRFHSSKHDHWTEADELSKYSKNGTRLINTRNFKLNAPRTCVWTWCYLRVIPANDFSWTFLKIKRSIIFFHFAFVVQQQTERVNLSLRSLFHYFERTCSFECIYRSPLKAIRFGLNKMIPLNDSSCYPRLFAPKRRQSFSAWKVAERQLIKSDFLSHLLTASLARPLFGPATSSAHWAAAQSEHPCFLSLRFIETQFSGIRPLVRNSFSCCFGSSSSLFTHRPH